jgi:hypothetical protein
MITSRLALDEDSNDNVDQPSTLLWTRLGPEYELMSSTFLWHHRSLTEPFVCTVQIEESSVLQTMILNGFEVPLGDDTSK